MGYSVVTLEKVEPEAFTRKALIEACQKELGRDYKPNYFMRTPGGLYKCFSKDSGHYRYVSLLVEEGARGG